MIPQELNDRLDVQVVAGYILAETVRAASRDPLAELLVQLDRIIARLEAHLG